jgi:cytochrome oxidase Cu insertion factor (SCO1/SenC/PrrC family)
MKKKYYYLYLFILVLLCSVAAGCQQSRDEPLSEEKAAPPSDRNARLSELLDAMKMYHFDGVQEAPSFELMSVDGENVSLHQYRGKVVLLSFWATW